MLDFKYLNRTGRAVRIRNPAFSSSWNSLTGHGLGSPVVLGQVPDARHDAQVNGDGRAAEAMAEGRQRVREGVSRRAGGLVGVSNDAADRVKHKKRSRGLCRTTCWCHASEAGSIPEPQPGEAFVKPPNGDSLRTGSFHVGGQTSSAVVLSPPDSRILIRPRQCSAQQLSSDTE